MREIHRNVRHRTVAQTLHAHVLDNTLFESITKNVETYGIDTNFLVYIDDWAIPTADIEIALKGRSVSLQNKINTVINNLPVPIKISVSPISRLNQDSKRKRFVDVIASVVSRSFLNIEDEKHTNLPLNNILSKPSNGISDITDYLKSFFNKFMDHSLRQNKNR